MQPYEAAVPASNSDDPDIRQLSHEFASSLRSKFSVSFPIDLYPPDPTAFGYRHLQMELLDANSNESLPLEVPQTFFVELYSLLLRLSGCIPTNTSLDVKFTPYHPDPQHEV